MHPKDNNDFLLIIDFSFGEEDFTKAWVTCVEWLVSSMPEKECPGVSLGFDVDGVDEEGGQLFSSTSDRLDGFLDALVQDLGVIVGRQEGRFVLSIFLFFWCFAGLDMFHNVLIYDIICMRYLQGIRCLHIFLVEQVKDFFTQGETTFTFP